MLSQPLNYVKCACDNKKFFLTLKLIIQIIKDKPCTAVTHIFDSSPPTGQAEEE